MPETSLYPAAKRFLETAGFSVKGEVNGCDVKLVSKRLSPAPIRIRTIVASKLPDTLYGR